MEPLFDSRGFGRQLREAMDEQPITWADLAAQAKVSKATISRALNGEPYLSHENYLRLTAWMKAHREAAMPETRNEPGPETRAA